MPRVQQVLQQRQEISKGGGEGKGSGERGLESEKGTGRGRPSPSLSLVKPSHAAERFQLVFLLVQKGLWLALKARKIHIQLLCSNCLSLPVSESRNSHFKSVYTWSRLIWCVNFHVVCTSPGKVRFGQKFHISSDPGYDHDKQLPHPWLCCGVSL